MGVQNEPAGPNQSLSDADERLPQAGQALERWRLRRLHELEVLDTASEPVFDVLAFAAAKLFGVPLALINFIDGRRVWNKAKYGDLDVDSWPREVTFCNQTLQKSELLVIEDTLESREFSNHPMVIGDPGVRFYVGAPLRLADGACVGSLCVVDLVPRRICEIQLEEFQQLASGVIHALESRLQTFEARSDSLVANERLANLYRNTPALFHALDRDYRIISVSDTWLASFGYKREQVLGRCWTDFLTDESAHRAIEIVKPAFLRSGRVEGIQYQLKHADGAKLDIEVSAIWERESAGEPLHSFAVVHDHRAQTRGARAGAESTITANHA